MRIEEKQGELTVVDFDEIEAYRIACKIEQDGIEFYTGLLQELSNNPVQKVFELLCNEEKKHMSFFEQCISALRRQTTDTSEDNDLLTSLDYGVFRLFHDKGEREKVLHEPVKALKLGIKAEDDSIAFYSACRKHVSSKQSRKTLEEIIEEEKKHKAKLKELLKQYT